MLPGNFDILFNMGNVFILVYLGGGYGILSYMIAVLVEAIIMKDYFRYPFKKRMKYSFLINLISGIAGVFFVGHVVLSDYDGFFRWMLLALILTMIIEYTSWSILFRKKNLGHEILFFSIRSNLTSYAILFVASLLMVVIIST